MTHQQSTPQERCFIYRVKLHQLEARYPPPGGGMVYIILIALLLIVNGSSLSILNLVIMWRGDERTRGDIFEVGLTLLSVVFIIGMAAPYLPGVPLPDEWAIPVVNGSLIGLFGVVSLHTLVQLQR